jgi:hypothetical protein
MGKHLQYLCYCDSEEHRDYFKLMEQLLHAQRKSSGILFYYRLSQNPHFNNAIFGMILVQVVIVLLQRTGNFFVFENVTAEIAFDACFTLVFTLEAYVKVKGMEWSRYWSHNWNRLDFILVCISYFNLLTDFAGANQRVVSGALGARALKVLKFMGRIFRVARLVLRCIQALQRGEHFVSEPTIIYAESPIVQQVAI